MKRRSELLNSDPTFGNLFLNPKAKLISAPELIESMDKLGINTSVIMGVGWVNPNVAKEANSYLIESSNEFPGRLIAVCSVNPNWGDYAIEEAVRCLEAGAKGIGELHPDTQGIDITTLDPLMPLMDVALKYDVPIIIHSSEPVGHAYQGKGETTPDKLYSFVRNFPRNTIVCAHWGGGLPFYSLMPEVAESLENVYFDTAASPFLYKSKIFSSLTEILGSQKILFATDHPLINQDRLLQEVEQSTLSDQEKEAILFKNARKILKL